MHYIPPPTCSVTLIADTGEKLSYASLTEALACLGLSWLRNHVGSHFIEAHKHWQPGTAPLVTYHRWGYILRGLAGQVITREDIEACQDARSRQRYQDYWLRRYAPYCGHGPVPGTGRKPNQRYYRALQSTQERRWSIPVADDGEPAPRGARNYRNLPDTWDDDRCLWDTRENHNWKRFRKTRWKA